MKFVYPCVVRGYHVYSVYWDPIIGEQLDTEPENDGDKYGDRHCVAVKKGHVTVGHILYLKTFLYLPSSSLSMVAESHARLREEGKDRNWPEAV